MIDLILPLLPYPSIRPDGSLVDGTSIAKAAACAKCQHRECRGFEVAVGSIRTFTCREGYSVIGEIVGGVPIRFVGVVEHTTSAATAHFRRSQRGQKVKLPEVNRVIERLRVAVPQAEAAVQFQAKEEVGTLHEIKALATAMLRITENAIWEQVGVDFDEKVTNASSYWREMFQAVRLFELFLTATDISVNPAAAAFGGRTRTSLHRIAFGIVRVLQSRALRSNVRIRLDGRSYNEKEVYRSFAIAIFALIDNAIKYSVSGSTVVVEVSDQKYGVNVVVGSEGSIVPMEERATIFDKGVRGSNAKGSGSGIGLYVAQTVARANGTEVHYTCYNHPADNPTGWNEFKMYLK